MAFTQSNLDAIDSAIASGELTVKTRNGGEVTYRSMDDLLKARTTIAAALAAAQVQSQRVYPRHQLANFADQEGD